MLNTFHSSAQLDLHCLEIPSLPLCQKIHLAVLIEAVEIRFTNNYGGSTFRRDLRRVR